MAVCYIWEYSEIVSRGGVPIGKAPGILQQTVAIAGGSAQSAKFNAATNYIRVHVDAICSINIGTNPTATTSTARLAQNQTEYFGVNPGDQLAVISNV